MHKIRGVKQEPERASILPQGSLVDGALTPVNSPAYTKGPSQSGSWRSESKSNYTLAGPSGSTMQEMDSLLAAEKVWLTTENCILTPGNNVVMQCKVVERSAAALVCTAIGFSYQIMANTNIVHSQMST